MKRYGALKLLSQLFVAAVLLLMVSCGVKSKILKSGDPQLIYDHALEFYEKEEWKTAGDLLEVVQPYFAGTMREDTIIFYQTRCLFKQNDFVTAITQFDEFRRTYGRSAFLEDCEGMYALSHYYISPAVERDQNATQQAILVIDEFLSRYPESAQRAVFDELRAELLLRLYQKSFMNAYTYYKIGRYKSAIVAFKNALKEYPESTLREDLYYYIVLSSYELAANSVLEKKEDRALAVLDNYYSFIAEYPDSEYRADVEKVEAKARAYIAKQNALREGGGVDDDNILEAESKRAARKRSKMERKASKIGLQGRQKSEGDEGSEGSEQSKARVPKERVRVDSRIE